MYVTVRLTLLTCLALFASPPDARAAPTPTPTPTQDAPVSDKEIRPVYTLAQKMEKRLRCTAVGPDDVAPPENVAIAAQFGGIASMHAFAAEHYAPTSVERIDQIGSLLDDAVLAYEKAYDCAPGAQNAFYLHRALELLHSRMKLVAPSDSMTELLADRLKRLQEKLPRPTPPSTCPTCRACATCPPPPPKGYRYDYAGRVALSVGFGGGQTSIRTDAGNYVLDHSTLRLTLGPRFVLGQRGRHIIGTGFHYVHYGIFRIDYTSAEKPSAIHLSGPYLEYGFALHRQLSLHTHVTHYIGAGWAWLADDYSHIFRAHNLGGGGALCTLNTGLCARIHGQHGIIKDGDARFGWDVTLSLDLLRIADLVLERGAPRP